MLQAIHMLDELFHLRYMLYITAYHHKIVLIIEKKYTVCCGIIKNVNVNTIFEG